MPSSYSSWYESEYVRFLAVAAAADDMIAWREVESLAVEWVMERDT